MDFAKLLGEKLLEVLVETSLRPVCVLTFRLLTVCPDHSRTLSGVVQKLGRIAKAHEGKDGCTVSIKCS